MTSERRGFIKWLLGGGFLASLASFLYPVVRFMNPPSVSEASVNEVAAGKSQDFKTNSGKILKFGSRPVLLIRMSEAEWKAFSAVCTHLNCTVQYRGDSHVIWCACHNGMYDLNGNVVSGPPPKPLEEYVVRLRGEEVFVSRRA
jgi:cytochrome b6-f complex iron-sulfur subunit